jgi:hypothetical protein
MAVTMISEDGTKRVTPVVVDGQARLRVEARGGRGWYFVTDTTSVAEVAEHVDISTLQPA